MGGRSFIRFITYVAIGGVAVGVAALVLSLAIVRGFSQEIYGMIYQLAAHVQVEHFETAPLGAADERTATILGLPGVERVTPVVLDLALLQTRVDVEGVQLLGVPTDAAPLAPFLREGSFDLAPDSSGRSGIVLGAQLADVLDVQVGDRVRALSLRDLAGGGANLFGMRPRVAAFRVVGIFETGLPQVDDLQAYVGIDDARALFRFDTDQVTRLDVYLTDVDDAAMQAFAIEDELGFPAVATPVQDSYAGLFAWVRLQRSIIPLVIGAIILVAAFNIIGMLLMVVVEKTKEIGILSGMGVSPKRVRRLFLWLGLAIGGVGTSLGVVLALAFGWAQQRWSLIPLPKEQYYMDTAPIALNAFDVVLVAAVALLLCALAAWVPARVASRVDPVRAVRFAS